jgi:hypothetical protein
MTEEEYKQHSELVNRIAAEVNAKEVERKKDPTPSEYSSTRSIKGHLAYLIGFIILLCLTRACG